MPTLPPEALHLWGVFVDLDESRPQGLSAPGAILYQELEARSRMTGDVLEPWEVRAIRMLDRIRRREGGEESGGATDG